MQSEYYKLLRFKRAEKIAYINLTLLLLFCCKPYFRWFIPLVIYCIHSEILMFLVKILSIFWIPNSYFMSFLYFIIIAIASTFISLYISRQFYKGKLRYLIGKY